MTRFVFTKENMPTSEELRRILDEAPPCSATEFLAELSEDLSIFEDKFNMSSDVFYAQFMRGEMGDDMPHIRWAGRYELYLETKHEIDNQIV